MNRPLSHRKIARLWGVSRTRIWQIEQRAIEKLRKAIEADAAAAGVSVREWMLGFGGPIDADTKHAV